MPTTAKGRPSLKAENLEAILVDHSGNDEITALCDKLLLVMRAKSPYATVKDALHSDGRVYPSVDARQATGRLSMTRPGMTIFGSRSDTLLSQREIVLPDTDDEVLVSVDLSQIAPRAMAAGCGDKNYQATFAPGLDAHSEMAERVFGDRSRRKDAKPLSHAINYGMGSTALSTRAGISETEAEHLLNVIAQEFPKLAEFKQELRQKATVTGYITTAWGRKVAITPGKEFTQAPAYYGQGTARDAFLEGLLALPEDLAARVRIMVHDELVLSVPRATAEDDTKRVIAAFESVTWPVPADVPVLAEAGVPGVTWAACYADE